jgi:hypothetical protein
MARLLASWRRISAVRQALTSDTLSVASVVSRCGWWKFVKRTSTARKWKPGWMPADPLISIIVATLILIGSFRLVRESVDILLEAVPRHLDLGNVHAAIAEVDGVVRVHDLHVWTLTSGYIAMSGHAVIGAPDHHNRVLRDIHRVAHDRFRISHVTFQIEHPDFYEIGAGIPDHPRHRRSPPTEEPR